MIARSLSYWEPIIGVDVNALKGPWQVFNSSLTRFKNRASDAQSAIRQNVRDPLLWKLNVVYIVEIRRSSVRKSKIMIGTRSIRFQSSDLPAARCRASSKVSMSCSEDCTVTGLGSCMMGSAWSAIKRS